MAYLRPISLFLFFKETIKDKVVSSSVNLKFYQVMFIKRRGFGCANPI